MLKGFKDFILRGNVIDLAVAVVIGTAFAAIVSAFTAGIIQPLINAVSPSDAPGGITALRVFAGYAGWSGGQLELELEGGGWFVLEAEDDDVFTDAPERLWRDVLRRQRGALRSKAYFPIDPGWN